MRVTRESNRMKCKLERAGDELIRWPLSQAAGGAGREHLMELCVAQRCMSPMYLGRSACFLKSCRKALSCITCHNPHDPVMPAPVDMASRSVRHAHPECEACSTFRLHLANPIQLYRLPHALRIAATASSIHEPLDWNLSDRIEAYTFAMSQYKRYFSRIFTKASGSPAEELRPPQLRFCLLSIAAPALSLPSRSMIFLSSVNLSGWNLSRPARSSSPRRDIQLVPISINSIFYAKHSSDLYRAHSVCRERRAMKLMARMARPLQ